MEIAIKGHLKRGREVIQLLESLGGINKWNQTGGCVTYAYYIDHCNNIYSFGTSGYHGDRKIYTLEEFEKEFPFKIGDIVLITGTKSPNKIIALELYMNRLCYKLNNGLHYDSETLTIYKEMKEERNITLTLDKAKEWYKKGGELKEIALQAYSKEELTKVELPKSFKEFCENYPVRKGEAWLGIQDGIHVCCDGSQTRYYKNWMPSKKSAEAHLAMMQLEQLRNCWRQGWEPNWDNVTQTKYCICCCRGEFKISTLYETRCFLTFPTREMAEEFLECFKDLIEKAGDLI